MSGYSQNHIDVLAKVLEDSGFELTDDGRTRLQELRDYSEELVEIDENGCIIEPSATI